MPRTPKTYTAFNEEKTLAQWANDPRCKVSYSTLYNRINKGEDVEQAITQESAGRGRPRSPKGLEWDRISFFLNGSDMASLHANTNPGESHGQAAKRLTLERIHQLQSEPHTDEPNHKNTK